MNSRENPNEVIWIERTPQRPLCDVPWLGTSVVLSDGNVNFCCFSNAVVGNVNHTAFENIWNGAAMQRIRRALSEQRLPTECQDTSCPIYRGDELTYLHDRMKGPHRFKVTGTHDPHAKIREQLQESELQVHGSELRTGDTTITLQFSYRGDSLVADLFVAVCYPNGSIRFLPRFESYAVPFRCGLEFSEDRARLPLRILDQAAHLFEAAGEYRICAGLFESGSNPNILSNCYWSVNKTLCLH